MSRKDSVIVLEEKLTSLTRRMRSLESELGRLEECEIRSAAYPAHADEYARRAGDVYDTLVKIDDEIKGVRRKIKVRKTIDDSVRTYHAKRGEALGAGIPAKIYDYVFWDVTSTLTMSDYVGASLCVVGAGLGAVGAFMLVKSGMMGGGEVYGLEKALGYAVGGAFAMLGGALSCAMVHDLCVSMGISTSPKKKMGDEDKKYLKERLDGGDVDGFMSEYVCFAHKIDYGKIMKRATEEHRESAMV